MLIIIAGGLRLTSYAPDVSGVYNQYNKETNLSLVLSSNHNVNLYTYYPNSTNRVHGNYTQSRRTIFMDLKYGNKTKHIVGKVNNKHQIEFDNFNPRIFDKSL
ncbi:hypothetical protein [Apilactobacillus ozensis]|uniref:hypothetical protein n=1 Tax=Apilactobacillus ozensis TaxID=866801 RepID=UPI002009F2DE|nr:hypothetical protein [Apilactobacillus ozensis]MCK8607198.1 hypothetical protein [Apilactobacillus ozensis]